MTNYADVISGLEATCSCTFAGRAGAAAIRELQAKLKELRSDLDRMASFAGGTVTMREADYEAALARADGAVVTIDRKRPDDTEGGAL